MSDQDVRAASLEYHRQSPAGKISIQPTKQLSNQRDLALAYSPGVAAACDEIVRDPQQVSSLTARGNLVGVVTNGTAVLGLGPIGPLAAKPVMEGKAVLFKKFAGIDCFDIELNERDPDKLVDMIAALEPTFGGINLEDIKAPECFYIERKCRERMSIPVFHDDQHGTAMIVGAAVTNGLRVVGKRIDEVKLVCAGAGAAALACLELLVALGLKRQNISVSDIKGVVYVGRTEEMDEHKAKFAQETDARVLAESVARRRHLPRALGRQGAQTRVALSHGAQAPHSRAGQPRARDHARPGTGGSARRHHRHRPLGLPQPGEQRPVLPVHL